MNLTFDKIIKDLVQIDFFSEYKFRKRDSSFIFKTKEGKQFIELDHWTDTTTSSLILYPIYGVRFDILSKWFEKFSKKSLQDQRDRASIAFSGDMLSMQDKFPFRMDERNYKDQFDNFQSNLIKSAKYVFSEYSSLNKLYNKTIIPILNEEATLPNVGADWIFIYLALCKLVEPKSFQKLKQIVLTHARKMYEHQEPNIIDYYDQLENIINYLELNQI